MKKIIFKKFIVKNLIQFKNLFLQNYLIFFKKKIKRISQKNRFLRYLLSLTILLKNCILSIKNETNNLNQYKTNNDIELLNKKIKLIIWDLDDTLWDGTIAISQDISLKNDLIKLISEFNSKGIISSICSNNDFKQTKSILERENIFDLFIYPDISYKPKGQRIKKLIEDLKLRDHNVLFIDDNQINLMEAKYFSPNLNLLNPKIDNVFAILSFLAKKEKEDNLKRFNQYKILEKQLKDKKSFKSNKDFLKSLGIKVSIKKASIKELDRILELVNRTNQLNYTKKRVSSEDLINRLNQHTPYTIYSYDKYGSHGLIGYVDCNEKNVEHFIFSCRILNLGIPEYIFKKLKIPHFNYVGEVAHELDLTMKPHQWIREDNVFEYSSSEIQKKEILFIGGCDLSNSLNYIKCKDKIQTYFNYADGSIMIHRDSIDFLSSNLNFEQISFVTNNCPFVNYKSFSKIDFKKFNTIVYSPLIDYIQGKYINKNIPNFYLSVNPFFLKKRSKDEIQEFAYTKKIDLKELEKFQRNWEPKSKHDKTYRKQLNDFFSKLSKNKIILINAAENTFSSLDANLIPKHIRYNRIIKEVALNFDNIKIINVNDFINSKNDFTDSIRHYQPHIYKEIADRINKII